MKQSKADKRQLIFCITAMVLAVCYCIFLLCASKVNPVSEATEINTGNLKLDYVNTLFDSSYVHEIDIQINEKTWQDLKDNSLKKEIYDCNLVIDGETVYHVGIRTKGNSTLLVSALKQWDKYSLVFDFTAFDETARYKGLDSMSLYNNCMDNSYMKAYLCLDMMQNQGVPTPLCNFIAVYLNGEYLGLYTGFEGIGESFAVRNFGYDYGCLYKPEQFSGSGLIDGTNVQTPSINPSKVFDENGSANTNVIDMLGLSSDTVALKYQGESFSAYDEIWENSIFPIGTSDKSRLIASIRAINEGVDLETVTDMQELARYFAVNAFVLNSDSYLTSMAHNYLLYEKDGQISMLPWDYDMTLGSAFDSGDDITYFLNSPIDTLVSGIDIEERPLLNSLMQNETWMEMYHQELQSLLDNYFYSEQLEETVDSLRTMLLPYVEDDLFTDGNTEQFQANVDRILAFYEVRTASIQGQLDGTIPSTLAEQEEHKELLADASAFSFGDSGGLEVMILGTGGVKLHELIDNIGTQINPAVIIKYILNADLSDINKTESNSDIGAILAEKGVIVDKAELTQVIIKLALRYLFQLLLPIISVIILLIALSKMRKYRKEAMPRAVMERRKRNGNDCR